jgi:hypothetical protein
MNQQTKDCIGIKHTKQLCANAQQHRILRMMIKTMYRDCSYWERQLSKHVLMTKVYDFPVLLTDRINLIYKVEIVDIHVFMHVRL